MVKIWVESVEAAGYTCISADDELGQENVSIENQRTIIQSFVKQKSPNSALTFYEDRYHSGYTFGDGGAPSQMT